MSILHLPSQRSVPLPERVPLRIAQAALAVAVGTGLFLLARDGGADWALARVGAGLTWVGTHVSAGVLVTAVFAMAVVNASFASRQLRDDEDKPLYDVR